MVQPRAVLTVEPTFAPMALFVAVRGDLAGADRRMQRGAVGRSRTAARGRQRQTMGAARSASLEKARRMTCVQSSSRRWWVWASASAPYRRASPRRRPALPPRRPPNSLGRLSRPIGALIATGTGGGGTIGIIAGGSERRGGPGKVPAHLPHPTAMAGRESRRSAAMKLARASARLSPRGSST